MLETKEKDPAAGFATTALGVLGRPRKPMGSDPLPAVSNYDWVYLVSQSEVDVVQGEVLPRLIRFPIDGGLMGVPGSETGDFTWEAAANAECRMTGRIIVDPARAGLEFKAFGQVVKPADNEDPADPRSWYVRRYRAKKGILHVSVWQRPRRAGNTVVYDHDVEGEIAFRRLVAEKVLGGIDSQVAENAIVEARQTAAQYAAEARTNPRAAMNAEVTAAALTKPEVKPGE